ncbi:MAG: hypothetical protein JRK53_12530 [Deltaproteobacteria bacterium]|nr:hypothetical protein [Deltaproteobacteria bacterium]
MNIKVYLFGTLPQRFPGYDPGQGLVMDLPAHATVKDLLGKLDITDADKAIVTSGGQVRGPGASLKDGMTVQLLQQVHGG